jgi:hypothetical protein
VRKKTTASVTVVFWLPSPAAMSLACNAFATGLRRKRRMNVTNEERSLRFYVSCSAYRYGFKGITTLIADMGGCSWDFIWIGYIVAGTGICSGNVDTSLLLRVGYVEQDFV